MKLAEMIDCMERSPVIASIHENQLEAALSSPAEVIFYMKANLMTVENYIKAVHEAKKYIFIHIDLADGIGKDKTGIEFLAKCGVDGIISTRGQMIRYAKELGLIAVQRLFALDTQGIDSINELYGASNPDFIEIMPGVIGKVIEHFSRGNIPVIASGLVETKSEVTEALSCGASAVSTRQEPLWYL